MSKLLKISTIQFIISLILLVGIIGGVYIISSNSLVRAVSGPISGPIASPTPTPTPTPDTIAPTVSITNPTNGATVRKNTTVLITAKASDNVAVSKVEVYVAGSLKCSIETPDNLGQYNCSWNVPKQPRVTYLITAKAYDSSNNTSQNTISVASR